MKRLLKKSYYDFDKEDNKGYDEKAIEEHRKNNKKYIVSIGGIISENNGYEQTDSPEEAITIWCNDQKSYPTQVDISCLSENSTELLNWAKSNNDKIKEIFKETGANKIYNIDKFIEMINNAHGNSKSTFDEYGGDSVFPFCQG